MNFFDYVPAMKAIGTPIAFVGIAILAIFLIVIVFKMLGGLVRGTRRQLVRTAITLGAAILAFLIAKTLSGKIMGSLSVESLEGLIGLIESRVPNLGPAIRDFIANLHPENFEYLLVLPATILVMPAIAALLFVLINLVLKVVRAIIIKVLRFERAQNAPDRLGGAILAAVEGVIVFTMITLPICSIISLVDLTYQEALNPAEGEPKAEIVESYDKYLMPITQNPAITFVNSVAGDTMANALATVNIDGKDTNMREEVLSVAHIIFVNSTSLKGADFTALNEEQKVAVASIIDTVAESPFMSHVFISMFNGIPTIVDGGLIKIDFGGDIQVVFDNFMTFFKTVNSDTLHGDLTTLEEFYFGMCDSGIVACLKNGDDLMTHISNDYNGDRHILGMINSLSGNDRTKGIVDSIYNLVLNTAFSLKGSEGDSEEAVNINIQDVKNGLNNIVSVNKNDYDTPEEYKEALSNTIDTTINDTIGVDLDDEVVDEISTFVDENYSEQLDNLTDEEFNELMFEIIDIYQGLQNGEEINPDDFEDILGDKLPQ